MGRILRQRRVRKLRVDTDQADRTETTRPTVDPVVSSGQEVAGERLELGRLRRMIERIGAAPTSELGISRACVDLVEEFSYQAAAVLVPDASGKNLIVKSSAGTFSPSVNLRQTVFPIAEGLIGEAVQHCGIALNRQRLNSQSPRTSDPGAQIQSQAVVPLLYDKRILGALWVESRRTDAMEQVEVDALALLGERLRMELDRDSLIKTLRHELAERAKVELEAKESLSQINAAFNASADGLLCVDKSGKVSDFNARFQSIWGIPDELVAQKNDSELLNFVLSQLEHPIQFLNRVKEVYSQPQAVTCDLVHFKDGRILERHSLPKRLDDGTVVGRVWSFRDVTARHKSEEAQRRFESRLFQGQKMEALGTLAGGIAHDFNNILAAIMGNADLLRLTLPPSSSHQEPVDEILGASRRARKLIAQILNFTRMNEVQKSPLLLSAAVEEGARMLRSSTQPHVRVKVTTAPSELWIMADATQIQQVLMNLGTNAVHALAQSGGVLEIRTDLCDPPAPDHLIAKTYLPSKPHARLVVRDTGTGMDPSILSKVFDPFFTTKTEGEGTGLGLASVQGIVHSHAGGISLHSELGVGTTFEIYFPLCDPPTRSGSSNGNSADRLGRGQTILVVDDEPAVGQVIEKMLRQSGYAPIYFGNSVEALRYFKLKPHDVHLVISDLTMPILGGLELADQIHQDKPDLPIVIMSGFVSSLSKDRIDSCGVQAVLHKPFDNKTVLQCLDELLQPRHKSSPKNE